MQYQLIESVQEARIDPYIDITCSNLLYLREKEPTHEYISTNTRTFLECMYIYIYIYTLEAQARKLQY